MKRKKARKRRKSYTGSLYAKISWDKAEGFFRQTTQEEIKHRDYPSTKDILQILAAVGTVGIVLAFPPALTGVAALMKLGRGSYSPWGMRRTLKRLKKQKYVAVQESRDGKVTVTITKNGMIRALTYELNTLSIQKPTRWDGKWRVVIFDVPEKEKKLRDTFRMRLLQMGLYQLQKSVYVSPYPSFNEIEFLRELYGIAVTVLYMTVEKIEDDAFLRTHFTLSG
ncbi:MAG: CRISPR-associated endonuclease Cas2 [Patescibacteria group bacterium]